jgi:uncharacterized protein YdhG (YjbR/CyaY superfamily)
MAKTRFTSVSEYIAAKPKEARVVLEQVRKAILKAIPQAEESLAYQMAMYTLNGVPVLYFAGWKAHYSLYPVSDAVAAAFAKELSGYERSKDGLKVPFSDPVPARLLERIAKFRADQLTARDKGTGGRAAQLKRVRRLCATLPSVFEKLSHGTPTFFVDVGKGAFAMFSDHHHEDGRLALWVPVGEGMQSLMIDEAPATYFKPPYVGAGGWIGIDLAQVRDDAVHAHLREAWRLIAAKMKK